MPCVHPMYTHAASTTDFAGVLERVSLVTTVGRHRADFGAVDDTC